MKSLWVFGFAIILVVVGSVLVLAPQAQADTVRYVKENGTGNGTSWLTASGTLQAMIDEVNTLGGGEVWVASGTYFSVVKYGDRQLVNKLLLLK